jgi:hypothetical protein
LLDEQALTKHTQASPTCLERRTHVPGESPLEIALPTE